MDKDLKIMARAIPYGSCPSCGHKQFVVFHTTTDLFLTNEDGAIVDGKELHNRAMGKCCNCGKTYPMLPTSYGFIPLPPIRELLFNSVKEEKEPKVYLVSSDSQEFNPMLAIEGVIKHDRSE